MSAHEIYFRALLARDYRFDGKFFVGVRTTGLYCRPICPAKPKRENIEFYPSALAAEKAGYRPCLRCRPECAPSSPAWGGKSAVVQRALRLLSDWNGEALRDDALAEKVGVSARHLRRLFLGELGRTPKEVHDTARLGFARQLIVETPLPFSEIAFASGFHSLRRFNDAFKKRFRRSPSQVRRPHASDSPSQQGIELWLAFRPPLQWKSLLEALATEAEPGVESVTEDVYERRGLGIAGSFGSCRVWFPDPKRNALCVWVDASSPKVLLPVTRKVRAMFDLDSDPLLVANAFSRHPWLERLWRKFPGLRLPGGWESGAADTDAFPSTDPQIKSVLRKHPDLDPETLRPWRSYLALYLRKESRK